VRRTVHFSPSFSTHSRWTILLRGLEVDYQPIFGRLLHGQVGGFGTLEDLVGVQRRAPVEIGIISLLEPAIDRGAGVISARNRPLGW
jgi:hypothetical protein